MDGAFLVLHRIDFGSIGGRSEGSGQGAFDVMKGRIRWT